MNSVPACTSAVPVTARGQIVLAACACAGASVFLYAVDPVRHAVYPTCLFYKTTGLYCAGCGATRALHALLHGRFLEALHDNALLVAALPVGLAFLTPWLMRAWRAKAWPPVQIKGKSLLHAGIIVLGLILAFTVLRNLPGGTFALLKPLAAVSGPA